MSTDPLGRCLLAPDGLYARALAELRAGRMTGHWIWFVLPQLRGLGRSPMAQAYGTAARTKAEAYPPIRCGWMAARARGVMLAYQARPAASVLGDVDALKFCSCPTHLRCGIYFAGQPHPPGTAKLVRRQAGRGNGGSTAWKSA